MELLALITRKKKKVYIQFSLHGFCCLYDQNFVAAGFDENNMAYFPKWWIETVVSAFSKISI